MLNGPMLYISLLVCVLRIQLCSSLLASVPCTCGGIPQVPRSLILGAVVFCTVPAIYHSHHSTQWFSFSMSITDFHPWIYIISQKYLVCIYRNSQIFWKCLFHFIPQVSNEMSPATAAAVQQQTFIYFVECEWFSWGVRELIVNWNCMYTIIVESVWYHNNLNELVVVHRARTLALIEISDLNFGHLNDCTAINIALAVSTTECQK